eukprot:2421318-Rhodomonas_salina.2
MDFSCFFLPFSNCTPASIRSASTDTRQEQPILDDGSEWNVKGGFPVPAEEAENIGWSSENVENRFWPKGRFWYRMALMQYVFRLQPSVRESLALRACCGARGWFALTRNERRVIVSLAWRADSRRRWRTSGSTMRESV